MWLVAKRKLVSNKAIFGLEKNINFEFAIKGLYQLRQLPDMFPEPAFRLALLSILCWMMQEESVEMVWGGDVGGSHQRTISEKIQLVLVRCFEKYVWLTTIADL